MAQNSEMFANVLNVFENLELQMQQLNEATDLKQFGKDI